MTTKAMPYASGRDQQGKAGQYIGRGSQALKLGSLQAAYCEAESIKRQDALIREEEEAGKREDARSAARAAVEREKKARKKACPCPCPWPCLSPAQLHQNIQQDLGLSSHNKLAMSHRPAAVDLNAVC